MGIILLKSAVCLAILMVFYKLFLENLAIHKFKRFYLLSALVISIVIPFITFTEYIEPIYDLGTYDIDAFQTPPYFPTEVIENQPEAINYIPILLWSLYGLGVLLFLTKFCINLFGIISKINKNEKLKQSNFISVLLNDLVVPHTFFSYIFLNKTKFKAKAIPEEVLLHEQTHASQKHSLDVLFIEGLQIIFWFNPLLYFIKKDIKLNHEFLADDAVLKQGIDSSTYQETLLQFTSTVNEIPLAHAINYSLIKKRFTLMKTKTSKKAIWLRSLLLLPLLGGLLFSFSGREQVEKEVVPVTLTTPIIEVKLNPTTIYLNGKLTSLNNLEKQFNKITNNKKTSVQLKSNDILNTEFVSVLTQKLGINVKNITYSIGKTKVVDENDFLTKSGIQKLLPTINQGVYKGENISMTKTEIKNLVLGTNSSQQITSFKLLIPRYPSLSIQSNKLNEKAKKWLEDTNLGMVIIIRDLKTKDEIIKPYIKITISENTNEKSLKNALKESVNAVSKVTHSKIQELTLIVNGIVCDGCQLKLSKKGVEGLILGTTTEDKISSYKLKFPDYPTESIKGNTLNKKALSYLSKSKIGTGLTLYDFKTDKNDKLSSIVITLVNKDDKNYSHSPKIKKGEQSQLPPPPPPPTKAPHYVKGVKLTLNEIIKKTPKGVESGYEMLKNGESHYFTVHKGKKTYYNKGGYITDSDGNVLLPPPPPPPPAPPKVKKGEESNIPPPPPRVVSLDYIVELAKKGASFHYNGDAITSDKAIAVIKKNPRININSQTINNKSTVYLSTKPISVENDRASITEKRKQLTNARKKTIEDRKKLKNETLENRKEERQAALESRKAALLKQKSALKEKKSAYDMQEKMAERQLALKERQMSISIEKQEKLAILENTNILDSNCISDTNGSLLFNSNKSVLEINCLENYPNNSLEIYNRLGVLIYKKENYSNDWDGTTMDYKTGEKGEKAGQGTYFYNLDLGNGTKIKSGYLYIKV